jgi:hypothetical protein
MFRWISDLRGSVDCVKMDYDRLNERYWALVSKHEEDKELLIRFINDQGIRHDRLLDHMGLQENTLPKVTILQSEGSPCSASISGKK